MTNPMTVLAVDPGKTSGICLMYWSGSPDEEPTIEYAGEVDEEMFASAMGECFAIGRKLANRNLLACERFTINAQTAKKSQAPYSLEIIGVMKHLARVEGYSSQDIVLQAPVDAKNMFPNPSLKKLGIWHVGGAGHALDSLRHAMLLLTKSGYVPSKLLE